MPTALRRTSDLRTTRATVPAVVTVVLRRFLARFGEPRFRQKPDLGNRLNKGQGVQEPFWHFFYFRKPKHNTKVVTTVVTTVVTHHVQVNRELAHERVTVNVRWSLVAGFPWRSGDPLRPSKSCILKRFSTPYIKPFRLSLVGG